MILEFVLKVNPLTKDIRKNRSVIRKNSKVLEKIRMLLEIILKVDPCTKVIRKTRGIIRNCSKIDSSPKTS